MRHETTRWTVAGVFRGAVVAYLLVGGAGLCTVLRCCRLRRVRRMYQRYVLVHYAAYGVFLGYLGCALWVHRADHVVFVDDGTAVRPSSPSLWRVQQQQQQQSLMQDEVNAGAWQYLIHAFARPWVDHGLPAPSSLRLASTGSLICRLCEPLLQGIASTALFGSFALLRHAQWRDAGTRTGMRWPNLRAMRKTESEMRRPKPVTRRVGGVLPTAEEAEDTDAEARHGLRTAAHLFGVLHQRRCTMRRSRVVKASALVRRWWLSRAAQTERAVRLADRMDSGAFEAKMPAVSAPGGLRGLLSSGLRLLGQIAMRGGDGPRNGTSNVSRDEESGWEGLVECGEAVGSEKDGAQESLSGASVLQASPEARHPPHKGCRFWGQHCPPYRRCHGMASTHPGSHARPPYTSKTAERERTEERHRRPFAATWLSNSVWTRLSLSLFALLTVARVSAAAVALSVWVRSAAAIRNGERFLKSNSGSSSPVAPFSAVHRHPYSFSFVVAIPRPTEGYVAAAALFFLSLHEYSLRRLVVRPEEKTSVVFSAAAQPPLPSAPQRRRRQWRGRRPRDDADRTTQRTRGVLSAIIGCGATTQDGSAGGTSPLAKAARLWHMEGILCLLIALQLCPEVERVWGAAALLTVGTAITSLLESIAAPLRFICTEHRREVGRSVSSLLFSPSLTPLLSPPLPKPSRRPRLRHPGYAAPTPGSETASSAAVFVRELTVPTGGEDAAGETLGADGPSEYERLLRSQLPIRPRLSHLDSASEETSLGEGRPLGTSVLFDSFAAAPWHRSIIDSSTPSPSTPSPVIVNILRAPENVDGDGVQGRENGASGDAAGAASLNFWNKVATDVLDRRSSARGEISGNTGCADGGTTMELGSTSGSVVGEATAANFVASLRSSFAGVGWSGLGGSTMAGSTNPEVNPSALLPLTPGMEYQHTLPSRFLLDSLKGSMLLTTPSAARIGGEAAAAVDAGAVDEEALQRPPAMEWSEQRQCREEAGRASQHSALNNGFPSSLGGSGTAAAAAASLGVAAANVQPSPTSEGWISRIWENVVPALVPPRHHSDRDKEAGASGAATPRTNRFDPIVGGLGVGPPAGFSTSHRTPEAAGHALIEDETHFEHFLECVRLDGDNTYALQQLLSVHGHTFGQRVDIHGRGALHYAAMRGYVQGAAFLIRMGAAPNVRDEAGYAPLHYAVLHHTEMSLSVHISDESASAAVQEVEHVLGMPVVAASATQAAAQARNRRQRRRQQQLERLQQQLGAAYEVNGADNKWVGEEASESLIGEDEVISAGLTHLARAHSTGSGSVTSSVTTPTASTTQSSFARASRELKKGDVLDATPAAVPTALPSLPLSPPANPRDGAAVARDDVSTAVEWQSTRSIDAAAVAAVTASVVPEDKGHWYGMVSALVRLGAHVDFPTTSGLTALHLAVIQGSLGLINTLLREGANPLWGSALEACAPTSDSGGTCLREGGGEVWKKEEEQEADIAKLSPPSPRQRSDSYPTLDAMQASENSLHDATAKDVQAALLPKTGKEEACWCADCSAALPIHSHDGDDTGVSALAAPPRDWITVHVTRGGNPIVNGYYKSPLLLAVELDADLVVASMLHHAALQVTAARAASGLPVAMMSSVPLASRPLIPEAEPAAAEVLPTVAAKNCNLPSEHPTTAAGEVLTSTGLAAPPTAFVSTAPYEDHLVSECIPRDPLKVAHECNEDGSIGNAEVEGVHNANLSRSCEVRSVHGCEEGPVTPLLQRSSTFTSPWALRGWWERYCPHGLNPLHIALVMGNAQVARVLLLRWSFAEVTSTEDRAPSCPTAASVSANVYPCAAYGRRSLPKPMVLDLGTGEDVAAASLSASAPVLMVTTAAATKGSTVLDLSSGVASSMHVDNALPGALESLEHVVIAANAAEFNLGSSELGGTAEAGVEGLDGARVALTSTRADGPHHIPEVADAPTTILSLMPSAGIYAFWFLPYHMNVFHLAAVGDSTECLAYALRWRGAPDYVPCDVGDIFGGTAPEIRAPRPSTAVLPNVHRSSLHHRPQPLRQPARQGSQALCHPSTVRGRGHPEDEPPNSGGKSAVSAVDGGKHNTTAGNGKRAAPQSTDADPTRKPTIALPRLPLPADSTSTAMASSHISSHILPTASRDTIGTGASQNRCGSDGTASKSEASGVQANTQSSKSASIYSSFGHSGDGASAASTLLDAPVSESSLVQRQRRRRRRWRRWRRATAHRLVFVQTLAFLLGDGLSVEVAEKRIRASVFGSEKGDTGVTERVASPAEKGPPAVGATVHSAGERSGHRDEISGRLCFGSSAAEDALQTDMAECLATMRYRVCSCSPQHTQASRERTGLNPCYHHRSSSNKGRLSSYAEMETSDAMQGQPMSMWGNASSEQQRQEGEGVPGQRQRHRHQPKDRAFVSAVACLRQGIAGVPIDIAHLAAIEMAVDQVSARTTNAAARRTLQRALLIVTRRLQYHLRCARLRSGLSHAAAAMSASSAPLGGEGENEGETVAGTAASASAVLTDVVAVPNASARRKGSFDVPPRPDGSGTECRAHTGSSSPRSKKEEEQEEDLALGDGPGVGSFDSTLLQPRRATMLPQDARLLGASFASVNHRATASIAKPEVSVVDSLSRGTATRICRDSHKKVRQEDRDRTLSLLRTLGEELNAVDANGLTALHYAIANRNAGMVYLLCAYGATFVFASEQTAFLLARHSADVMAAVKGGDVMDGSEECSNCHARGPQQGKHQPSRHSPPPLTSAPAVVATTLTTPPDDLRAATGHEVVSQTFSSTVATPATAVPAGKGESVAAAADALLLSSERYYAALPAAAQSALRRAAKAGSAECLLLWMPARDKYEAARRRRQFTHTAGAGLQHSSNTAAVTDAAGTPTTAAAAAHENRSSFRSTWPPLPQPTTMATTLMKALGVDSDSAALSLAFSPAFGSGNEVDVAAPLPESRACSSDVGSAKPPSSPPSILLLKYSTLEEALASQMMGTRSRRAGSRIGNATCDCGHACSLETGCKKGDEQSPLEQQISGEDQAHDLMLSTPTLNVDSAPPPSASPTEALGAAAAEYLLLEPHDVFLMHVVRDPHQAESLVRAGMEGTALRYLHLASVIAHDDEDPSRDTVAHVR